MYCPRCGSQSTDTTRFCRQCGLALAQVMDYVASGGTGALTKPPYQAPPPPPPPHLMETSEMLALKHKRTLTILSICIAPIIFAILSNEVFHNDDLVPVTFMLIPLGIVWARFRYRMKLRQLEERQLQEYYAQQQYQPAPPQQAPGPKLIIQAPSAQSQLAQSAQIDAPRTNPLAEPSRGSVIEDETRKLPEQ